MLLFCLSFMALLALVNPLPVSFSSDPEQAHSRKGRLLKRQYPYPYYPYAASAYSPYAYTPPAFSGYPYPYTSYGQPQTPPLLSPYQAPPTTPPTSYNPCADPNSPNWKVDCNGGSFTKTTVVNGGFSTVQESGSFSVWKSGDARQPFIQPFTDIGTNGEGSNGGGNSGSCNGGFDINGLPCSSNSGGGSSGSCIGGLDSLGLPCSGNGNGGGGGSGVFGGIDTTPPDAGTGGSGTGIGGGSGTGTGQGGGGSNGGGTCVQGVDSVTGLPCGKGSGGTGTCTCDATGIDCNGNTCTPPDNTTAPVDATLHIGVRRSVFLL